MNPTILKYAYKSIIIASIFASSCGDSNEAQPPSTALPDTGVSTPDSGAPEDAANNPPEPDATLPDAPTPDTDLPDAPPAEDCTFDGTCWDCAPPRAPKNQEQLLNACTELPGVRFDNAARLPLLNADGSLPPLP